MQYHEHMYFSELATYYQTIEYTSSRLDITRHLANLFAKLSGDEIQQTTYLLQGRVAPLYQKVEFGLAEKMVIKAAGQAFNMDAKDIEKQYKQTGDLGKTIEQYRREIRSFDEQDLPVKTVFNTLHTIATIAGVGSQEKKINHLSHLVRQLDPLSCRYIVRIPVGAMRLGFSDMTVLDALSWMLAGDKSLRPQLQHAYHVRPDLGLLCRMIKEQGIAAIETMKPTVFSPIIMMRATRLSSGQEILDQIGECAIEPKYDGFRLQAHYSRKENKVKLYSRGLEEVSYMYPDIVEAVIREVDADSIIIEGEAIGFDTSTQSFLPFQETVQRKRKHGIAEKAREIPLKFFTFELLYLDGNSYIDESFTARYDKLKSVVRKQHNIAEQGLIAAPNDIVNDPAKIEALFDAYVGEGLEGIIAKKLSGHYQPGAREYNWIKFKRSYSSKIQDTIDCLVMGYDYGKGKRNAFGIGAFMVGVYDGTRDEFVTVAKIGTGLTDDEWRTLKELCGQYKTESKPALYSITQHTHVDVWTNPQIVVEIKADEITKSSMHSAGLALRFPRLECFRDDRKPEDATTLTELQNLYNKVDKEN